MHEVTRELEEAARAVEAAMGRILPDGDGMESRLYKAMRYATLSGGKRLRPFLVLASSRLFSVAESCALRVAAAIEFVHCYSLVHDDLPAMDDDELRRGRPTCHVEFDEATAILAGDALLTLALEVLAEPSTHADPAVRCELVRAMASAAGGRGMVGGQMMDLVAEKQALDIGTVTRLQRLKTGEIIAFACEAGAILGKAPEPARQALHAFAHDLGLAAEGSVEEMGKAVGKDSQAGKATFVSILGIEQARTQARMLAEQAVSHLDMFDAEADPLRRVVRFVVERRN